MGYRNLVEKGIAFLDEKRPEGWKDRINLNDLQMQDTSKCILAQLYGSYDNGCYELGLGGYAASRLGFYPSAEWYDVGSSEAVTQIWKEELATETA